MWWHDDHDTPTRVLARSLVHEALGILASQPPTRLIQRGKFRPATWTRETAIQAIRAFVAREGRVPTATEFNTPGPHHVPSRVALLRLWPRWRQAVIDAGFDQPARQQARPARGPYSRQGA